jgi:hypothetical protein
VGARWDPNAAEACLPAGTALVAKRGAPSTRLSQVARRAQSVKTLPAKCGGAVAIHQMTSKPHRQLSRVHTCPSILSPVPPAASRTRLSG